MVKAKSIKPNPFSMYFNEAPSSHTLHCSIFFKSYYLYSIKGRCVEKSRHPNVKAMLTNQELVSLVPNRLKSQESFQLPWHQLK